MKIIGVIPARYDSKRFPGKALALLHGKPIIQHVYERAKKSVVLDGLVVATDDKRIYQAAVGFGAPVVITPEGYNNGTERIARAMRGLDCEAVINIQGDQPFLEPEILDSVTEKLLFSPDTVMSTPVCALDNEEDIKNPNVVKTVIDREGFALYFSRASIPFMRNKPVGLVVYKHIGIYAYRRDFLQKYARLQSGVLEETEGLEQLRVLENGYRIMTVVTNHNSPSIDTEEDLRRAEG